MTRPLFRIVFYSACVVFVACCWLGAALLAGWVRI